MSWPQTDIDTDDTFAEGEEEAPGHVLDVYLADGRPSAVLLDGESVLPTWFKLEFKENGDVSAKVKGVRLSTRLGDVITIHTGTPPSS